MLVPILEDVGPRPPEELSDLPVILIRAREENVMYRLEGCFDHHLDLYVEKPPSQPTIRMVAGEYEVEEMILWKKEN